MKKKNRISKPVVIILIATVISVATYFLVDYLNIPTLLGLRISEMNMAALDVFSNAITAILIFALTYYFVERWNIRRQDNQKQMATLLLGKTYNDCMFYLSCFDAVALQKIVERTDFNAYYNHDSPAAKFADIPFENEQSIMQYAGEGIIPSSIIEKYFEVKDEFSKHITMSVTFFDHLELIKPTRAELLKLINEAKKEVNNLKEENG